MRPLFLLSVSVAFSGGAAFAEAARQSELTPVVVELRLNGRSVESLAWRDGVGEIFVERTTLSALALQSPPDAQDPIALRSVTGLSYVIDEAQGAVAITCTAQCFAPREIAGAADSISIIDRASGGFLNVDLTATAGRHNASAGGLFELGLFSRHGYGGVGLVADSERGDIVRLETHWTIDLPDRRERLRMGDGFVRGGASGVPLRFGGVQYGTDFSLDPGFIPFPTPTLRGEAATPSVVDLFIDGALQLRSRVDAGPFSITDAPVLSGGGVAQIVVTDALGRQQVFSQAFYTSPLMLRPGLAEHSISAGFERENFTLKSDDYGRGFASAFYRRGFTNTFTGEVRVEAAEGHNGFGAAASFAHPSLGQLDIAAAASGSERDGALARIGWQRATPRFSIGLEAESASAHFTRIGENRRGPGARRRASAFVSADLHALGSGSLAYAVSDDEAADRAETLSLSYSPRTSGRSHIFFNALHVRERDSHFVVSLGLSRPFGEAAHVSTRLQAENRRLAAQISAQRAPDPGGGFGWRARAETGERQRLDGAVAHIGQSHEAGAEISITKADSAVRVQYATGVAWIGGETLVSRPVRESFALVDIGAADVAVQRDRRAAGVTNARGRVIITGLRPYEQNRISIDANSLPWDTQYESDEILITPAARSGALARLPRTDGGAGEITLVSNSRQLRPGEMLVREADGARFPIAAGGRVYLSGVSRPQRFTAGDCAVMVSPADLGGAAMMECAS